MEGFEEHTKSEHVLHRQRSGSGFQSSPPPDPNPESLDPPLTHDNLKQIVTQEVRNLTLKEAVNSEILNLAREQTATDHGSEFKQAISEELHLSLVEELQYQVFRRLIDEAIDKEADHEENPEKCRVSEENEVNGKGSGHEENPKNFRILEEDEVLWKELRHEEDGAEDKNEIEDGNDSNGVKEDDYEDRSSENEEGRVNENEEERESEDENVGEDTGSVAALKDGKPRRYHYPLRPDAEDCSYYMRTGMCKFGSNCKFNHSLRRKNQFVQAVKETVKQNEENSDRPGQTECKYYLSSGGCKYGKACRFNHSRGRTAVAPILEFNFLGLPIRMGEKECPYYMRTGSCKYGSNCRFNHPDPTAGGGDPPAAYGGGSVSLQAASQTTMSSWSSPRTLNETASFVPMMYSPTQGIPSPNPEWNGYQAPAYLTSETAYLTSETSLPTPPAFAINNPPTDTNLYIHHQQQMLVGAFPERPGQPECSYFLKTGDCKYRSVCKFHHPKSRIPKTSPSVLSDKGLPLRPDQNICMHYSRYGICKYGPACKYDHPVNYSNSASAQGSGLDGARMAVEPEGIL